MMKRLMTLALSGVFALLFAFGVTAQEIKVTTSPNPVKPGGNIRITFQSGVPISKADAYVAGRNVALTKVSATLYTASVAIPAGTASGTMRGSIRFSSPKVKEIAIPFQFEVSAKGVGGQSAARVGEGGGGVTMQTDPNSELNIKVDQLEDRVVDLQKQRDALNSRVQSLNADLKKLQSKKTPEKTIQDKADELKSAQADLDVQEKELAAKNDELTKQLNDLVDREKVVQEREKKLSSLQSEIEKSKSDLSKQSESVKAESQRIKSQESDLLKREDVLATARATLANQAQAVKLESDKISVLQAEVKAKQAAIKTRESELASIQSKVGAKESEINAVSDRLKAERDELSQLQKSIETKSQQIERRERDINRNEAEVKRQQKELNAQSLKFETDRLAVQKRDAELKEKEKRVFDDENKLNALRSEIDSRQKRLESEEEKVNLDKESLAAQKKESEITQQNLTKKENELVQIQSELEQRNSALAALNQKLDQDRQSLDSRSVQITDQRKVLAAQSESLEKEKESIKLRAIELNILVNQVQLDRQKFEQDASRKDAMNAQERQDIERRQKEITSSEELLRSMKFNLEQQNSDISVREAKLSEASRTLLLQMDEMVKRQQEMKDTEAKISKIRNDIYDKYASLEDLKRWVEARSNELKGTYATARADRGTSEAVFQEQFERLERLTRVLQERTYNLDKLNQSLVQKNNDLELEIRETVPTRSQFSVGLSLGYRSFSGDTKFKSGGQAGFRFIGSFSRDIEAEIGISIVPTMEDNRSQTLLSIEGNLTRTFWSLYQTNIYGLAGITVDMASKSSISPQVGVGLKWVMSDDYTTRFDLIKNRDFVALVGFQKRLVFDQDRKSEPVARVATAALGIPAPSVVEVPKILVAPEIVLAELDFVGSRYHYQFNPASLSDTKGHWAEKQLNEAVRLGLISEIASANGELVVEPNRPLTLMESAKLLALAVYLPKEFQATRTTINYAVDAVPGLMYLVNLSVVNSSGNVVKNLLDRDKTHSGDHQLFWDWRSDSGQLLPIGTYTVVMNVFSRAGKLLSTASKNIEILAKSKVNFESDAPHAVFDDISADYPEQPYIDEWVHLGNNSIVLRTFDQGLITAKSQTFNPNQMMSRLSFILGVSNAIQAQGVQNYALTDLSPYRDIKDLPLSIRNRIGFYVSELDYGGDDRSRLRPFDLVTRAEAAVIAERFLNWHCKRLNVIVPSL